MDKGKGKMVEEYKEKKEEERKGENTCNSSSTGIIGSGDQGTQKGEQEDEKNGDESGETSAVSENTVDILHILVAGYLGAGKSTLLKSLNARVEEGLTAYMIAFNTNENGCIRFVCSKSSSNKITNTSEYDGFILIFDLKDLTSYKYTKSTCDALTTSLLGSKPVILVGNKCDISRKRDCDINAHKDYNVPLFRISAREKLDVHKPFLELARSIRREPSLMFINDVPTNPVNAPSPSLELVSSVLDRASTESSEHLPKTTVPVNVPSPSLELVSSVLDQASGETSEQMPKPTLMLINDVPTNPVNAPSPPLELVSIVLDQASGETSEDLPKPTSARKELAATTNSARKQVAKNSLRIRGDNDDLFDFIGQSSQSQTQQCCYL